MDVGEVNSKRDTSQKACHPHLLKETTQVADGSLLPIQSMTQKHARKR